MDELISKKELLEDFEWLKSQAAECSRSEIDSYIERIKNAPTVDAEPVRHGRWLKDAELNTYCSCCDGYIPTVRCHQDYEDDEYDWDEEIEETEFCPNCGAKMLKKGDEGNEGN